MRCEYCHGGGKILVQLPRIKGYGGRGHKPVDLVPCPECGGSGKTHCCEGLMEQPETSVAITIGSGTDE